MMEKRILHINDIHMRERDFSTVKNYVSVLESKLELLIKLKSDLDLYGIIINGDLCDNGYHDKLIHHSHINLIKELGRGLHVFALNIGNHFYIERDNNIELFLIQPHKVHKMRKHFYASEPIIATPETVCIDSIQFSLFNYSPSDKNYVRPVLPGMTYHVGLYHDEVILPRDIRSDLHLPVEVTTNYRCAIFKNIDEGICAHIHKPFGTQYLSLNNRIIPLHIPGSISITENSSIEQHEFVDLPLHVISGSSISTRFVKFPTLINELVFKERKDSSDIDDGVNPIFVSDITETSQSIQYGLNKRTNLISYLEDKGYKSTVIELIKSAITGDLDETKAIKLHIQLQKGGIL